MLKSLIEFLNKSRVSLAPRLNNRVEPKNTIMKKIYLLLTIGLFVATISASAQNVVLRLDDKYDVSIDGRNYANNSTISTLGQGQHTINVYEVKKGFLGIGKKKELVSTSNFELRNNDVTIDVDQYGQLRINESGNYNTQNRRYDRTTDPRNTDRTYDRNAEKSGKGYGPYNNPGKGHKYGLYKDKNNKVNKSQKANKGKGNK